MRARNAIAAACVTLAALLASVAAATPAATAGAAPRVYHGSAVAVPGWMGMVVVRTSKGVELCGGTAIMPNVILTADHCVIDEATNRYVAASQIRVIFGQADPFAALKAGVAPLVPVVRYDYPRGFGVFASGATQDDIALLELARPAQATIALAPTNRPGLWRAGTPSLVLGWGLTNDGDRNSLPQQLLSAPLTIRGDAYCRSRVPDFSATYMLCAGNGRGPSPCQGDSGGPLLVSDAAGQLYEVGVVNFGSPCQLLGGPNVFARIGGTVLGRLIAANAPKLQADADARGEGPVPPAPAPTPAPAPAGNPAPGAPSASPPA